MAKIDGGFAFPFHDSSDPDLRPGMTLRDWFAGQVLAGLFSQSEIANAPSADALAQIVYGMADAMIAEREAGDE